MNALYTFLNSNIFQRLKDGPTRTPWLVREMDHTLPVLSVFGPGTPVSRQLFRAGSAFSPIQVPQVRVDQTWTLAGYGGPTAGQIMTYALSQDPLGKPMTGDVQ